MFGIILSAISLDLIGRFNLSRFSCTCYKLHFKIKDNKKINQFFLIKKIQLKTRDPKKDLKNMLNFFVRGRYKCVLQVCGQLICQTKFLSDLNFRQPS